MIVKLCGLRTKRDALSAIRAGVDEIGFVVGAPESKRNITAKRARKLLALKTNARKIAVTVAKSAQDIEKLIFEIGPKIVQIHGDMPKKEWAKILGICKKRGVEIIRAVRADKNAEKKIRESGVMAIVLDSATVGGTGRQADWKKCARIVKAFPSKKIKLSGGLTPENVSEAIKIVRPWAVDTSSGVEENGKKSLRKMKEFVKAAKRGS